MSTNLEIESKASLLKEEYEQLINSFDATKVYEQINYYIDTALLDIVEAKCGLRIRQTGNNFELTLKIPSQDGKIEINQQISNILAQKCLEKDLFPAGEVAYYIESNLNLKKEQLHVLGKLVTYRLDIKFKTSLISIDKSMFNGFTDYEIECEDSSLENSLNNLQEFLNNHHIKYRKNKRSKLRRFLDTLA